MAVMMRSMLEVADNSGARKLQMILPLGGSTGLNAGLGDVITASVKEAAPEGQVQKGKVVKAVIVRTRKEHRRRDGTYIRFDRNAVVLFGQRRIGKTSILKQLQRRLPGAARLHRAAWLGGNARRPQFAGQRQGADGVIDAYLAIVPVRLDPRRVPVFLPGIVDRVHHERVDVRDRDLVFV